VSLRSNRKRIMNVSAAAKSTVQARIVFCAGLKISALKVSKVTGMIGDGVAARSEALGF